MRNSYFTVKNVGAGDVATSLTSSLTDASVAAMMPYVNDMMEQKVLPMMLVGLLAGAAISAAIGSYFATRSGSRRRSAL